MSLNRISKPPVSVVEAHDVEDGPVTRVVVATGTRTMSEMRRLSGDMAAHEVRIFRISDSRRLPGGEAASRLWTPWWGA